MERSLLRMVRAVYSNHSWADLRRVMQLIALSEQRFEMRIVGYQFPELSGDSDDSNWLRIAIDVVHPRGAWSSIDASLLTYEAARLAAWLEAIAIGERESHEEGFTEPNLSFRLVDGAGASALRVYFELESRPRWAQSRTVGEEDLYVEFPLSELDLATAANELRKQLKRYPERPA